MKVRELVLSRTYCSIFLQCISRLKLGGNCIQHALILYNSAVWPQSVAYLCVSYDSQSKQQLFPQTALAN
jgi:hypothetical protein